MNLIAKTVKSDYSWSSVRLEAVSEILSNKVSDFPPAECILDAIKLWLECNNSVFNNQLHLRVDGTTMGPHMPCSYRYITMCKFDLKALNWKTVLLCWKRFRDDVFVSWNQSLEELNRFFDFMNSIDILVRLNLHCLLLLNLSKSSLN